MKKYSRFTVSLVYNKMVYVQYNDWDLQSKQTTHNDIPLYFVLNEETF